MRHAVSVVVPVRNERENVDRFLAALAAQRGVETTVVIVDGDSRDGTIQRARESAARLPLRVRFAKSPPDRMRQIQSGVELISSPWTLIMHADCRLTDDRAIAGGIEILSTASARSPRPVGGRFCLRFDETGKIPPRWIAHQESKARMNRPDCIHGDQGLLLPTGWLRERIGSLPTDRPMLTETLLANRMLEEGEMLLFGSEIVTSGRRFVREGFVRRQLLNALILGAHHAGWDRFFQSGLPLYRSQGETGRLPVRSIVRTVARLLQEEPASERKRILSAAGAYLASQTWQLALLVETVLSPKNAGIEHPLVSLHDRLMAPLMNGRAGSVVGTFLVRALLRL